VSQPKPDEIAADSGGWPFSGRRPSEGALVYLDTSVALAEVFAEDRRPAANLWQQRLISSRLLEYEITVRCIARGAASAASHILARVSLVELAPTVLERVLSPFPAPVRTLDAMHLATIQYLREHGQRVQLATYDERLKAAALAMDMPIFEV
jgi:predicted nucleic acid-binding protein